MARAPGRPGRAPPGRAPGQPGRGQLGEHLVDLGEHLGEHLVDLGELSVQLAIATDPGPADRGQVYGTAATAGQGSWGQA
jgi:hypothetical protein